MSNYERDRMRFKSQSVFDEASYYQGLNFQIGGGRNLYRSDKKIEEDALKALRDNLNADIHDVKVVVLNGVIKLSGSVNQLSDKREVENSVERIPGIADIQNELKVRRMFG